MNRLEISKGVFIPGTELDFTASRSSGPGGQNVNKVSTRVTVRLDVAASPSLSDAHKQRILARLATRANREGVVRVVSQRHRSQAANRAAAVERLVELLREALRRPRPRRKTQPSRAARARRLARKKLHSRRKQQRSKKITPDDY